MESKRIAIVMVGKTHSGKTTFAEILSKKIPESIILQTDPFAEFLNKNYPKEINLDIEHDGTFRKPSLKFKLFQEVFNHVVNQKNFIPILANSNMHQKARTQIIEDLKRNSYYVIGIYLNLPEKILRSRIKKAKRDTRVLSLSKDFDEVLSRQENIFIEPQTGEFDSFFEITDQEQVEDVIESIVKKSLSV